jgi:hypothetical protein
MYMANLVVGRDKGFEVRSNIVNYLGEILFSIEIIFLLYPSNEIY